MRGGGGGAVYGLGSVESIQVEQGGGEERTIAIQRLYRILDCRA